MIKLEITGGGRVQPLHVEGEKIKFKTSLGTVTFTVKESQTANGIEITKVDEADPTGKPIFIVPLHSNKITII